MPKLSRGLARHSQSCGCATSGIKTLTVVISERYKFTKSSQEQRLEDRTIAGWGADTAPVTQERETYWSSFYAAESSSKILPSAQGAGCLAHEREPDGARVVGGCGSGRDSLFFAALGFKVLALDRSEEAIRTAKIKPSRMHLAIYASSVTILRDRVFRKHWMVWARHQRAFMRGSFCTPLQKKSSASFSRS